LVAGTWKHEFQDFRTRIQIGDWLVAVVVWQARAGREYGTFNGVEQAPAAARDNRFMPRITLHYAEFSGMGVTPANAT